MYHAAVPRPVPCDKATCIHHQSVQVIEVKITGHQDVTTDLSYYEVSMNDKKANVSVYAPSKDGIITKTYYPASKR
jgi:hypothetical protein